VKLAVFGMGYVGSVTSACLASLGHRVVGVDVVEWKVQELAQGRSPIVERDLPELITRGVRDGSLRATTDADAALADAEVVLVCVGTPSREDGSLDLGHSLQVTEQVGRALRRHPHRVIIVFRSTVLPGSVEGLLVPALERASGLRLGADFGVAYNPEFLREGTAVADFFDAPYAIVGASDAESARAVEELYRTLPGAVHQVDIRSAEMLKYVNNAFHALKVAFANEIGRLCQREGVDSHEIMRLFCLDTKLNISPHYLKPGFAFGGSCLPKDLRALTHRARERHLHLPVLEAILFSNDLHVQAAVSAIERQQKKRIGVLGLSFKAETDDLRESPIIRVIGALVGKGYEVLLHDHQVDVRRLLGANRKFLESEIPYLERVFQADPRRLVERSEVVVIANSHPNYRNVPEWASDGQVVVDLVRLLEPSALPAGRYVGLAW
jgi:GDP-mannose 6-dehydrogenase